MEKDNDKLCDELREDGYKDYNDYVWQRDFEYALSQYESKMMNPYE